jgi:hypothetical protein
VYQRYTLPPSSGHHENVKSQINYKCLKKHRTEKCEGLSEASILILYNEKHYGSNSSSSILKADT